MVIICFGGLSLYGLVALHMGTLGQIESVRSR
jgi:hypothetical protein